jgi:hypothetical protein
MLGMPDEIITKVVDAMRAKPRKGRGAVYRWLWDHHAELVRAFAETDAGWDAVSGAMCEAGVVGARGRSPTRKSLPKVWARVVRDKGLVSAGSTGPDARRMPSRTAAKWRPSVEAVTLKPLHGEDQARTDEGRPPKMRVVRSLDDARAATETAQSVEPDTARPAGVGVLPRARWPKPFN